MIRVRKAGDIYNSSGEIDNGTFNGRWHFAFAEYYDPRFTHFGTLRVFNDDTLSPGAVWPLHPHRDIEVVTYCAGGEFRHADQRGIGGILRKGWVQHTTVGRGMYHSELNNRPDEPMRFIQMWFMPSKPDLEPSVEQKEVAKADRKNKLLCLVSNDAEGALPIVSDAEVYSSFLEEGNSVTCEFKPGWGGYLYVLEGGPVWLDGNELGHLDAAMAEKEAAIIIKAKGDCELLLVKVLVG